MAGAAVAMIVPSRFSMKNVPATSSASGRLSVAERRRVDREGADAVTGHDPSEPVQDRPGCRWLVVR
ncbi:hypothetical protein GCM10009616_40530 [Microlunatus lacustris]